MSSASPLSGPSVANIFGKKNKGSTPPPIAEYAIMAPDGGWGWVVVIAAFYCNVVIDGILFTFGIYLPVIEKFYETTNFYVALINSCMYGIHLAAGPLSAALTRSFGMRPMVIVGSILSATGLALAFFNPPLWLLTILFGFFVGFGMCVVYMSSITVTSMYFSRLRVLAVGIVVCGTGAGTVIFSLAGNYMLKSMPWGHAHLLLGFLALLMALAGLTFRPLQPVRITTTPLIPPQRVESRSSVASLWDDDSDEQTFLVQSKIRSYSVVSAMDVADLALETYTSEIQDDGNVFRDTLSLCLGKYCTCLQPRTRVLLMHPNTRKDLIYGTGKENLTLERKVFRRSRFIGCQKFKETFSKMDWKILKDPSFALFCLTGALTSTGIITFFTFEKARTMANGYSEDKATMMVAILGASNLCWRLLLGGIATIPKVNYHSLNVMGHCLAGISIMASGFTTSFTMDIVYCIFIGFGLGSYAVFRPVILVQLVGMEKLSNATGISLMFMGIFCVFGPPIGGIIISSTGGYAIVQCLSGLLFISSGVMSVFIRERHSPNDMSRGDNQADVPNEGATIHA